MSWNVAAAPHFATVGLILEHFMELKLCIPYVVSNLGKSRVQRFKWCTIWIWNEEVMAIWRWTAQSQSGNFLISQSRPHFEGCFAAVKPPFGTRVPLCSAVLPFRSCEMGCENPPPLQNPPLVAETISKLQKWDAIFFFMFHFSFWLPNGYKMIFKLQNGYENAPGIKIGYETPLWLRTDSAAP